MKTFLAPILAVVLFGAGCSSAQTTQPIQTPPAAQPVAQVPAPAPSPLQVFAGKLNIKMTGAVTKEGTFNAFCKPYFPMETKGIVFQSDAMDGWTLQVGDVANRHEGPQVPPTLGILNGPDASYIIDPEGAQVVFGTGLKSATVKAKFKQVLKENVINVDATFTCQ